MSHKRKGNWIVQLVALALLFTLAALGKPDCVRPETASAAGGGVVIDHTTVDAAQIPQAWLDQARALDIFFAHKSVGNNILDGMADLQALDAVRYTMAVAVDGPAWFTANSGILHQSLGTNGEPYTKIDGFDAFVRGGYGVADAAMMKFCPGDTLPFGVVPAAQIWDAYRDMMTALQADYPNAAIVWWTMPVATAADNRGNEEKTIFNTAVRSHCAANHCILFDIAAIESHDPDGNPVFSSTGDEAMWVGYASDGAHLNEVGRRRVAQAFWWLFARLAGWPGPETPGFTLDVFPADVTLAPGAQARFTIALAGQNGFDDPVALFVSGLPPGSAAAWSANPVTPPGTSTLTVTAPAAAPCADYELQITGTTATAVDAATAMLRVRRFTFLPLVVTQ